MRNISGRIRLSVLAFVCLFRLLSSVATGQAGSSGKVVVLDTYGSWRMHNTLKPPVVEVDGQLKPRLSGVRWLDGETPPAPPDWQNAAFDDGSWVRGTARQACCTPYLARLCLRGKFSVTDPARVRGLTVSVDYHGGAVVCLNGREFGRANLPAGTLKETTLAEPYPLEVYVDPEGHLLANSGTYIARGRKAGRPDAESTRRMKLRVRSIRDLAVPRNMLRKGVNVLAVELIRAPYHKVLLEADGAGKRRRNKYDWKTCQISRLQLTAAGAGGLVPNATRPEGLQVWNTDPMAGDTTLDWGDPCEPLAPVRLVGALNGSFSGKVVVGSTKPIKGLRATASDLKGPGFTIPASAVRIRYGVPWGTEVGLTRGGGAFGVPYPAGPSLLGQVVETPPDEIAVHGLRAPHRGGATAPVLVTVRVPMEAQAGTYTGRIAIQVQGGNPVRVPVALKVADWILPDPQNYRTWMELIQVPDTLAVEYGIKLWSDRHFRMIGKSFALIRETGTRVVYVPLIAHTNLGNAESMVRWIKKGGNKYDWDFSTMDRYLDLAQKHLGTPKIVVLQVWELYMRTTGQKRFEGFVSTGAPQVTVLDPASGRTELVGLPKLSAPGSKAAWQALLTQMRARLKKRGLEKAMMLGMFTDMGPSKEDAQFFKDLAPDLAWVQQGHGLWKNLHGIAEVGYQASVWGGYRFADGLKQTNQREPPVMKSLFGWKRRRLDAVFERNHGLDCYPLTRWRFFPHTGITGDLRGIGRVGADYWPVIKDARGRRRGLVHNRFKESRWMNDNLRLGNPVLAPGPEGPVATNRLLALVEGVQECEARIAIERALTDQRAKSTLGANLAARCQRTLDERLELMWKTLSNYQLGGPMFFGATAWRWTPGVPGHNLFLGSGWQERNEELFTLAGEVERKLGIARARRAPAPRRRVASRPVVSKRTSEPPARRATRTVAASDVSGMRRVVIDGVKRGRKERVSLRMGRGSMSRQVVGADEKGITIRTRGGAQMGVPWSSLPPEKLVALAAKYK